MRKSIALILGELDNKVGGYVALLQFRYSNLCVKADPCSLLPVTVNYDDNDYDIEDVAYVRLLKEDQLQVYPKDSALLLYIGKAIAEYHPEFKQEIVAEKDPSKEDSASTSQLKEENEEDNKSLILTMPEVDKNRRDVLMDGVKVLYEQLKATLDANFQFYTQKVVLTLSGASAEEIKEAKDSIEDIKKQNFDLAKKYRENKEKEIEDAYKRYLEKKSQKDAHKKEKQAATNKEAGHGFKMAGAAGDHLTPAPPTSAPKAPEMPKVPKTPEMPKAPKMPK